MIEDTIILLGYPRSGNTWLRYIIECLYNKPTVGPPNLNNDGTPIIDKTLNSVIGYNFPDDITIKKIKCMIHCHLIDVVPPRSRKLKLNDNNLPPMIFVLRDYKDCVYRQAITHGRSRYSNKNLSEKDILTLYKSGLYSQIQQGGYIPTLKYFHNYKGKKMLIKYEDLMDDESGIQKVLQNLNIFLEVENNDNIIKFLDKIDIHTQNSINNYQRYFVSNTKGKNKDFYKNIVSEEIFKKIDKMVKNSHPTLFEKYLDSYEIGQSDD